MNNITPYPVLEYIVNVIKNTISDIKIEYTASGAVNLKDGNDAIQLEQVSDQNGSSITVVIKDPKDILFSEDLLPALKDLHEDAKGELKSVLQTVTVVINGLNVETRLIFQTVKDCFDQLSNSYEFLKAIEKEGNKIKSTFKFGSHSFNLTVANRADEITVEPDFSPSFDAGIKKTVEHDTAKVQKAVYTMFKEGKI